MTAYFCDSKDCVLHVPLQHGKEWAEVNGLIIDRLPVGGSMRCLLCRAKACRPLTAAGREAPAKNLTGGEPE